MLRKARGEPKTGFFRIPTNSSLFLSFFFNVPSCTYENQSRQSNRLVQWRAPKSYVRPSIQHNSPLLLHRRSTFRFRVLAFGEEGEKRFFFSRTTLRRCCPPRSQHPPPLLAYDNRQTSLGGGGGGEEAGLAFIYIFLHIKREQVWENMWGDVFFYRRPHHKLLHTVKAIFFVTYVLFEFHLGK